MYIFILRVFFILSISLQTLWSCKLLPLAPFTDHSRNLSVKMGYPIQDSPLNDYLLIIEDPVRIPWIKGGCVYGKKFD